MKSPLPLPAPRSFPRMRFAPTTDGAMKFDPATGDWHLDPTYTKQQTDAEMNNSLASAYTNYATHPELSAVQTYMQSALATMQAAVDAKTPVTNFNTLIATVTGKADVIHAHIMSDVQGLQAALSGKASIGDVETVAATVATLASTTATDISTKANKAGDTFTGAVNGTTFSAAAFTATTAAGFIGDGSGLTSLDPTKLSAIVPVSKLGTGASTTAKFLRGDGSWSDTLVGGFTVSTGNVTLNVGDVETTDSARGLILKSPLGTRWRVTVSNTGALSTASL